MMDNYRNGIYPPGAKDAYEHDGIVAFLPLVAQQSPNLDFEKLKSAIKLSTQFPFSIGHHLVEAELLSKFIEGSKTPIDDVKNRFYDTMLYQEIMAVEKGIADGIDSKKLVKKLTICRMLSRSLSQVIFGESLSAFDPSGQPWTPKLED